MTDTNADDRSNLNVNIQPDLLPPMTDAEFDAMTLTASGVRYMIEGAIEFHSWNDKPAVSVRETLRKYREKSDAAQRALDEAAGWDPTEYEDDVEPLPASADQMVWVRPDPTEPRLLLAVPGIRDGNRHLFTVDGLSEAATFTADDLRLFDKGFQDNGFATEISDDGSSLSASRGAGIALTLCIVRLDGSVLSNHFRECRLILNDRFNPLALIPAQD